MKTRITLIGIGILLVTLNSFAQLLPAQPRPLTRQTAAFSPTDNVSMFPVSPSQLVQELLGPAALISNLTYTGNLNAIGKFVFNNTTTGMDSGIIITTGTPANAIGPNTSTSQGFYYNGPGDSLLTALANQVTYDASIVEFDINVSTDTIACQFIFGSEEYPEFVIGLMNDIFGFFMTGVDPFTQQYFVNKNIAVIPGTQVPISIGTINNVIPSYPQYYVDNTGGLELQYDGYTIPMTLFCPVINGDAYHLKIAIADGGDPVFDSGIFLKGKWISGYAAMPVANFAPTTSGLTTTFDNSTTYAKYFVWDFGDGSGDTTLFGETCAHTYDSSGIYNVLMKAVNYYQVDSILQTITVGNVGLAEYDPTTAVTKLSDGIFRLDLPFTQDTKAEIYTLDGRIVKTLKGNSDSVITLDIRDLPEGVYFVQIISGKRYYSARLIR